MLVQEFEVALAMLSKWAGIKCLQGFAMMHWKGVGSLWTEAVFWNVLDFLSMCLPCIDYGTSFKFEKSENKRHE